MNKKIFSYSIGYIGQGITYNLMSTYFVLFMTDCVGMSSSLAGLIMSLALLVEVVTGTVVGNISDHFHSRWGKRRPFILISAVTMPVILLCLFRRLSLPTPVSFAYYLLFSVLFRISFSTYEIPFSAFGAEIATGYDERTQLRTVSRFSGILGNACSYILPLLILDYFTDQAKGWNVVAIIASVVCVVSWISTFILTSDCVSVYDDESTAPRKGNILKKIFGSYMELAKLRTMRILIVYKAAFACALALFNVGTVYYMKYCAGMSNRVISYVYAITVAVFIITTPLINKMALKMGKGAQQKWTLGIAGILGLVIYLFFRNNIVGTLIYVVVFAATQNGFWQMSPCIFYDIVEVDEFENGSRRQGDIMSMVSVLGTLTTAVIVQVFGYLFDLAGYAPEAAAQNHTVVEFLNAAYLLVPSVCFLIGAVALLTFPINKRTFNSLTAALALKREGKDYSEYRDDLKKVLN